MLTGTQFRCSGSVPQLLRPSVQRATDCTFAYDRAAEGSIYDSRASQQPLNQPVTSTRVPASTSPITLLLLRPTRCVAHSNAILGGSLHVNIVVTHSIVAVDLATRLPEG